MDAGFHNFSGHEDYSTINLSLICFLKIKWWAYTTVVLKKCANYLLRVCMYPITDNSVLQCNGTAGWIGGLVGLYQDVTLTLITRPTFLEMKFARRYGIDVLDAVEKSVANGNVSVAVGSS